MTAASAKAAEVIALQNSIFDMHAIGGEALRAIQTLVRLALRECERGKGRVDGSLIVGALHAIEYHAGEASDAIDDGAEHHGMGDAKSVMRDINAGNALGDAFNMEATR